MGRGRGVLDFGFSDVVRRRREYCYMMCTRRWMAFHWIHSTHLHQRIEQCNNNECTVLFSLHRAYVCVCTLLSMLLQGEKIFYLVRPTQAHIEAYERWTEDDSQSEVFFGDLADNVYQLHVKAGSTLLIPSGEAQLVGI